MVGPLAGKCVLDLFSGSGLMALEALSRGADSVFSIESSAPACRHLEQVRNRFGVQSRWRLLDGELPQALAPLAGSHFDLVYADPPYAQGWSEQIPLWLQRNHIECALLVIEESSRVSPLWPSCWQAAKVRRYGETSLHLLQPSVVAEEQH